MERINYRKLVQIILTRHSGNDLDTETEVQLLFDTERDHYQVVYLGSDAPKMVYGCVIFVDIKDGKKRIHKKRNRNS